MLFHGHTQKWDFLSQLSHINKLLLRFNQLLQIQLSYALSRGTKRVLLASTIFSVRLQFVNRSFPRPDELIMTISWFNLGICHFQHFQHFPLGRKRSWFILCERNFWLRGLIRNKFDRLEWRKFVLFIRSSIEKLGLKSKLNHANVSIILKSLP